MLTVLLSAAPCLLTSGGGAYTRRDALASATGASAALALGPPDAAFASALPGYKALPGMQLNNKVNFPTASFGLQIYDDKTAEELTLTALECGYRNFFASVLARNQRGFARAIKRSGIPREDLFICGSVLSNQVQGFDAARRLSARGCQENLEAFAVGGIEYVDMIMLDYPGPDADSVRGQWDALEAMLAEGTTKSLAVSNFSPAQLDVVIGASKVGAPTVNQLPYGVGFNGYYGGKAAEVVAQNKKRGVVVQAWSPLGRALRGRAREACAEIGAKYKKSAAQVALRWIADTGCTYTTQTKSKSHFKEDDDIFDFQLTPEEIQLLGAI